MKAHRPAALAGCVIATAAGLLSVVPTGAALAAPKPHICKLKVVNTSSTHIRSGLALRVNHRHTAALVRPRLPSRMLNGTIFTSDETKAVKVDGVIWDFGKITKLVSRDPSGERDLTGWAATSNGQGTRYLRQVPNSWST